MIMILVITLIVVGFTQITNRNNREALDKQLSTQAFYAAESGVNQAKQAIDAAVAANQVGSLDEQTVCDAGAGGQYGGLVTLSNSPDVRATCLLVNPINENIITSADLGGSTVVPIDPMTSATGGSPGNLDTMSVEWSPQNVATAAGITDCNTSFASGFPVSAPNCPYGVLRIDLMQYQSLNSISGASGADTAAAQTETFYFIPATGGTNVATGSFSGSVADMLKKAHIVKTANCTTTNTTNRCKAVIDISNPAANKRYYARLSSLYKNAPAVVIDGINTNVGGGDAYFRGIFKIDATGKAQDVLRRVQVRYNPVSSGGSPFGALEARAGVCKELTVISNSNITSGPDCN